MIAAAVTFEPFTVASSRTLFSLPRLFAFDVTSDGKRFVVAQDAENRGTAAFVLVSGWFEELKAKMRPAR